MPPVTLDLRIDVAILLAVGAILWAALRRFQGLEHAVEQVSQQLTHLLERLHQHAADDERRFQETGREITEQSKHIQLIGTAVQEVKIEQATLRERLEGVRAKRGPLNGPGGPTPAGPQ